VLTESGARAVMNRGERIANKTKSAIKKALLELIQEKNYPDITVGDITGRGNVGRSTLYKHYQSKADVLVDIHKDMFEHLFSGLSTSEAWFAPAPPSELFLFFERSRRLGKNPFLLSYKLGSDLDYLMSNINLELAAIIEKRLRNAFNNGDSSIPFPILAQSISNLYSGLIMSWFTKYQSSDICQFATNIHRMTRALIYEAIGKNTT
jgi:AcrR family transcriptional regulator